MARVAPASNAQPASTPAEDEYRYGWLRDMVYEDCTREQVADFEERHGADWWRRPPTPGMWSRNGPPGASDQEQR